MKTKLVRLSILVAAFAFIFAFGSHAQAAQTRVDSDLGIFHVNDVNSFGDDRALNAASGAADRDSNSWTGFHNSYGLMGDYGRESGF